MMFESPRKSTNVLHAWSESQEELHETQPVSPPGTEKCVKVKKKKIKQQRGEIRSVSASQLPTDDGLCADGDRAQKETKYKADEPIVRGIFQIGKKSHDVVLTAKRVTWTPIEPETPTGELRRALFACFHGDYTLHLFTSCAGVASL